MRMKTDSDPQRLLGGPAQPDYTTDGTQPPATTQAIAADSTSAAILGVAAGSPLLAVDRVTLTYGDCPVEVRRGLCTTRAHHYFNELF